MTQTPRSPRSHANGRPGGSARAAYRSQRARLARMTLRSRLLTLIYLTATGALISATSGHGILPGAAIAAGAALLTAALLATPDLVRVTVVLVGYAPFLFPMGAFYTAAALGTGSLRSGDAVGGAAALTVLAVAATWLSVRYSRGHVWVTLLAALASTILIAPLLVLLVPGVGLNAARLTVAVVLLARCGGWAWLTGAVGLLIDRSPEPEPHPASSADMTEVSAWTLRADAEQATAALLDELSSDAHVFHDVHVPKVPEALGHLVLAPSGGFLIASVASPGPLTEDRDHGLQLPGVPLDQVTGTLMRQRSALAKTLHRDQRDFALLIAIHSEQVSDARRTVAVFDAADTSLPAGQVTVLSADRLLTEISTGFSAWSEVTLRQVHRRARMRLRPALAPLPVSGPAPEVPLLTPLDPDGNPTAPLHPRLAVPSWMTRGTTVNIITTRGTLTDLRIAGEAYVDAAGRLVVPVCVNEEWQQADRNGTPPRSYPYPVRAIRRAG